MGFYNQFPYVIGESLNIDWVLDVVKHADETLKDINSKIELVVRPMIDAQDQFYQRLINQAESAMRNNTAAMQASLKETTAILNRSVYESNQKVDKALTKVSIDLANQKSFVESQLSQSLNQMTTTLAYYSARFESDAIRSQTQLAQMIKQHNLELRILIEGQKAQFAQLKLEVEQELSSALAELHSTSDELKQDMYVLESNVTKQNDINLKMLTALGDQLLKQLEESEHDLVVYYKYTKEMFDGMWQLMDHTVKLKADKTWVQSQLDILRQLILDVDGDIILINPANNQPEGLQKILYDIYNAKKPLALTAGEYDALKISAGEYDALKLTAYQYDNYARWYLILYREIWDYVHEYVDSVAGPLEQKVDDAISNLQSEIDIITDKAEKCCTQLYQDVRMFNPYTGTFDLIKDVVSTLLDQIRPNALTAAAYDALHITAQDYDNKHITAQDYDWNGKNIFGGV